MRCLKVLVLVALSPQQATYGYQRWRRSIAQFLVQTFSLLSVHRERKFQQDHLYSVNCERKQSLLTAEYHTYAFAMYSWGYRPSRTLFERIHQTWGCCSALGSRPWLIVRTTGTLFQLWTFLFRKRYICHYDSVSVGLTTDIQCIYVVSAIWQGPPNAPSSSLNPLGILQCQCHIASLSQPAKGGIDTIFATIYVSFGTSLHARDSATHTNCTYAWCFRGCLFFAIHWSTANQ